MYNQELKIRFINEYTTSPSTKNACESIFNQFEKYEREWGADLCTRTSEELQPIINNIVGLRARSKYMRIIVLKDYVKWCMNVANVKDACNGMLQINSVGLDKLKRQTVSSPLHLQKYLDIICEPESNMFTDNIYRCYYWLAYGGVAEEDILSIKCSDVDFTNMVVHYKNTEVPIYREAVHAFKNCVELSHFMYEHPNYSKKIWRERVAGDTLVRGIRSNTSHISMRVELSRRAKNKEKETDLRLSYFRVWISGVFYMMYERELSGEEPDFSSIVKKQMERRTYNLDSGRNTLAAKKRQLEKDYMNDYERWKLTFKM